MEATLPLARALCTGLGSPVSPCSRFGIDAGCADVGRGGGDGGGGRGGGRTNGGGSGAGGSAGRWAQRVGAAGEAPRWPDPCCCGKDRFCAAEPVRGCCRGVGAGFLAASERAGGGRVGKGRWAGCLLGSWPDLVRELSECALGEVRLCSTPAVYAVACLASSQPAAIFDCTGSTIDLAMEAIDETTAAPVEPRRCGGWEAAMLWAAAIASIATMVRWGLAGGVPSIQCVAASRPRERGRGGRLGSEINAILCTRAHNPADRYRELSQALSNTFATQASSSRARPIQKKRGKGSTGVLGRV